MSQSTGTSVKLDTGICPRYTGKSVKLDTGICDNLNDLWMVVETPEKA